MSAPDEKLKEPPLMDWGMAAINGLIATLVVLQRRGTLDISDVVTELGNTIDFRAQRFPETKEREYAMKLLYDLLMQVEKQEADRAALIARIDAARGKPPG